MSDYSEDVSKEAETHPTLGAEYFESRNLAQKFLAHWTEDDARAVAEAVIKPAVDAIYEKALETFQEYLLSNAEYNIQGEMRRMVEQTVRALIGGRKWANVKYLANEYDDGQAVRETLAKLYADQIKDGRIADLERQVANLKESLEWALPQWRTRTPRATAIALHVERRSVLLIAH